VLCQRKCKICNSPEHLVKAFTLCFHAQHFTYKQLIEMFRRNHISINIYNCNVHIQRHLTSEDFAEAEATQAQWDKNDSEAEND
jgi:hypothetical protein